MARLFSHAAVLAFSFTLFARSLTLTIARHGDRSASRAKTHLARFPRLPLTWFSLARLAPLLTFLPACPLLRLAQALRLFAVLILAPKTFLHLLDLFDHLPLFLIGKLSLARFTYLLASIVEKLAALLLLTRKFLGCLGEFFVEGTQLFRGLRLRLFTV